MKTRILCNALMGALFFVNNLYAANDPSDTIKYRRSSIYTILLEHPGYKFGEEIKTEFINIPLPDKYNDHNLSVRSFYATRDDDQRQVIESFFTRGEVAKRLISKWFNRTKETGAFNMEMIANRGCYNASYAEIEMADMSVRGRTMLEDAGEELIGHTFVVLNDIQYIDKERRAQNASLFLNLGSAVAGAVGAASGSDTSTALSNLLSTSSSIADLIAGFSVEVTSYLYRLEWNDKLAGTFYSQYYFDNSGFDSHKKEKYENCKELFNLNYIGKFSSKSGKTVARGVHSNEEVIRKVCARALDENYVELARKFDVFKVKSPIVSVDGKIIQSPIGLKEGVTPNSKYEILEIEVDNKGKSRYKRVGIVKPIKEKIWDNRFMAMEEEAPGSDFLFTSFQKISGGNIYPGMLIREIH